MSELINLDNVGTILSNIGNMLIGNQNLLKCIKYNTPNALSQSNLIIEEIIDIAGQGTNPINQQRIFKYPFYDNIVDEVRTELRFFIPEIKPQNIYLSELSISFQIITHNSLIDLDDNKQRTLVMVKEILTTFNGNDVGGIGNLILSKPIKITPWNSSFSGYYFNMNTRST